LGGISSFELETITIANFKPHRLLNSSIPAFDGAKFCSPSPSYDGATFSSPNLGSNVVSFCFPIVNSNEATLYF
jgi:hypothetical protein